MIYINRQNTVISHTENQKKKIIITDDYNSFYEVFFAIEIKKFRRYPKGVSGNPGMKSNIAHITYYFWYVVEAGYIRMIRQCQ